jgi:hypothetical protein
MNDKELRAKVVGLISGIQSFNEKERGNTPSGSFAENYNRIVDAIADKHEELRKSLPPRADTYQGGSGKWFSHTTYCEMLAHLNELRELLDSRE